MIFAFLNVFYTFYFLNITELDINNDLIIGISDALLSLKRTLKNNNQSPNNCKEILDNKLSSESGFYLRIKNDDLFLI